VVGVELGGDVVDLSYRISIRRAAPGVEDDRAAAVRGGRGDGDRDAPAGDVIAYLLEGDKPCKRARERLGVQQGVDAPPAQAKQLARIGRDPPQGAPGDDWRQHVPVANRGPQGECLLDELRCGDVRARGEVGRVERAHTCTHEDRRALPAALELGQQYRQRPHLVGTAGSTAR